MPVVVVATGNAGKLAECAAFLAPAGYEVEDLSALPHAPAVEESGSTFAENARIKAEAYSRLTPHLVLADDSGLEVDALSGAPGVLSARYGGPDLSDPGLAVGNPCIDNRLNAGIDDLTDVNARR